jgi:hypothetical protein
LFENKPIRLNFKPQKDNNSRDLEVCADDIEVILKNNIKYNAQALKKRQQG